MELTGDGHLFTFIARSCYFGLSNSDGRNIHFNFLNAALVEETYAGQIEFRNNFCIVNENSTRNNDGGCFASNGSANTGNNHWIVNTGNNRFETWAAIGSPSFWRVWYNGNPNAPVQQTIFQNDSTSIANTAAFSSPGSVFELGNNILSPIKLRPTFRINKS